MEKKTSILIVDDNISILKTMSFVLRRKGYDVSTAKNGLEAIDKVKEKKFDLIFMDIKMPLLNGIETYKKINKIIREATVIMMTAYSVDELIQEALKEGAYEILYKPIDFETIFGLIEKALINNQGALILIVDDDPGTCKSLKNILSKKGYKAGSAYSGEEAITIVKKKKYDIIFIDMKMPTLNGLETYLIIKKINPKVVTVMMTAYHQEMNLLVQEAISNNAYTCLYKPLDITSMLKLIKKILEEKKK